MPPSIGKTLAVRLHPILPTYDLHYTLDKTKALAQISAIAVSPASYQRLVFILHAFRTVQVQHTQCFIHAVKLIILTFLAEMH